jgi:predicted DNA-binding protein (UPF0251 family)
MPEKTINDTSLLRLIDKESKTQAEAAKVLGVSRQAVNIRLKQLRGRTSQERRSSQIKGLDLMD